MFSLILQRISHVLCCTLFLRAVSWGDETIFLKKLACSSLIFQQHKTDIFWSFLTSVLKRRVFIGFNTKTPNYCEKSLRKGHNLRLLKTDFFFSHFAKSSQKLKYNSVSMPFWIFCSPVEWNIIESYDVKLLSLWKKYHGVSIEWNPSTE